MDDGAVYLAHRFLQLILPLSPVSQRGAEGKWHDVWLLLAEDPWFQGRLRQLAGVAIRRVGLESSYGADVEQDVLLRLARRLRSNPTLSWDRQRTAADFSGWMSEILSRECRCVARRTLDRQRPIPGDHIEERQESREPDPRAMAIQLDVVVALQRLTCEQRTAIHLHLKDKSIREIAGLLDTTWWRARRLLRDALAILRSVLGDEEAEESWLADQEEKSVP